MNVLVHLGDEDLKRMLLEHGIVMERPTPPNDVTTCKVVDKGIIWFVQRFWNPER